MLSTKQTLELILQTLDTIDTVKPELRDLYESELAKAYNSIDIALNIVKADNNVE